MVIIIFGVSGSGKTTIGKQLSQELNIPFFDADDFHPQSNIEKMASGQALNDQDRYPWLVSLGKSLGEWPMKTGAIVACSALKEKYRQILTSESKEPIIWVHLYGSEALIQERVEARKDHFMNPNLVRSQFETLEIPDYGLHINVSLSPKVIIKTIVSNLSKLSHA
jgi:carbohydrate kinase (thermoresistant glucokinase family)